MRRKLCRLRGVVANWPEGRSENRARQGSNLQPSDSKSGDQISQHLNTQGLTENSKNDLALCLALLAEKCPDLAQVVEAWPKLPEHVRKAIILLADG